MSPSPSVPVDDKVATVCSLCGLDNQLVGTTSRLIVFIECDLCSLTCTAGSESWISWSTLDFKARNKHVPYARHRGLHCHVHDKGAFFLMSWSTALLHPSHFRSVLVVHAKEQSRVCTMQMDCLVGIIGTPAAAAAGNDSQPPPIGQSGLSTIDERLLSKKMNQSSLPITAIMRVCDHLGVSIRSLLTFFSKVFPVFTGCCELHFSRRRMSGLVHEWTSGYGRKVLPSRWEPRQQKGGRRRW